VSRENQGTVLWALALGCTHSSGPPNGPVRPTSRERLAQALRDRRYLDRDAPKGTQLGQSIRQFQKSQGLAETGYPDRETLSRLGIDPATVDSSLDPSTEMREGATNISPSH
jgi:peptidoglycan hydrolase-like protein with peptidoglycan-binding domain